jgi:hypothetical protein
VEPEPELSAETISKFREMIEESKRSKKLFEPKTRLSRRLSSEED